jgi:FtsH-binding integral membrane protein
MDTPVPILTVLFFLFICIYRFSFNKRGQMTCDHYVGNTLLFLTLAITIIFLFMYVNEEYIKPPMQRSTSFLTFLAYVAAFVVLLIIFYSVENRMLSLMIWLAILYLFSYILMPLYRYLQVEKELLYRVAFQFMVIFVVFTLIGFYKPHLFHRSSMFIGLMVVLLLLIVSQLIVTYAIPSSALAQDQRSMFYQIVSIIAIVVFSLFIWYDIGTLRLEQNLCSNKTVNYMKQSFGLLLDVLNLFQSLVGAQINS